MSCENRTTPKAETHVNPTNTILGHLFTPDSPGMFIWAALCAAAGSIVYIVGRYLPNSESRSLSNPLPPGPPGLPWVGNVIGINTSAPWLTYSEWAKTYGDLIYTRILGKEVIIINSENVAKELLDHRSRNYSDRPHLITNELCGTGFNSGLLPYGDTWRLHRRFFHQTFNNNAVTRFRPLQYRKSCQLLRRLLNTPAQFADHVFDYTASLILNSVYDYDPGSRKDELVGIAAKAIEVIVAAVCPEVALIIVVHLPSWFPGMSFKNDMAIAKELADQYVEKPFEFSIKKLTDTGFAPSMVHDSLRKVELGSGLTGEERTTELKGAAASAFLGGAETSTSVIVQFFLMMVLNPHIQAKAQAQIDLTTGAGRLPTIEDRASLPYVDAILREVYRYNPVVPLALPHSVVDDDIYLGFRIPKGSVILTNLWSMAHDESKYPDPHTYIPERFLDDNGRLLPDSTKHLAFGFGRRICPGKYFADTAVWSAIASILAVFSIYKAKDANGVEIPVEPKFSSGLTAHPLPFECNIVPRMPGMDAQKLEELIAANTL